MKKLLFLIPLVFFGCKAPKPIYVPIHDSTSVEATETITEHPTWTIPDSAYWRLAFECDSNFNVLLKQFDELNTGIGSNIQIKEVPVYREDKTKINQLQVDISVIIDSLEVQNRTIEKLRNEKKVVQVPYPVPGPEVKYIPQRFKWYRNILLMIVLAGLGYVVIKYKLWKFFIK